MGMRDDLQFEVLRDIRTSGRVDPERVLAVCHGRDERDLRQAVDLLLADELIEPLSAAGPEAYRLSPSGRRRLAGGLRHRYDL